MRRGTAAIAGALGYFSSASPPGAKASAAAAPGAETRQQEPSSGGAAAAAVSAAVSDVSLIEEGQGGGEPCPSSGSPGSVTPQKHYTGLGEEAVPGGGGGVSGGVGGDGVSGGVGGGGVGAPGREGDGVLTRVVAVEEPWQSIYLWSLLFVKTTSDLRLFDSRTIRLFDVSWCARAVVFGPLLSSPLLTWLKWC